MNHFVTSPESQRLADLHRLEAGDAPGITNVVGDETACDLLARLLDDTHRIAPRKGPLDAPDSGRQEAFAARQRLRRAGIDHEPSHGNERSGDPALARLERRRLGDEPGRAGALAD